MSGQNRWLDLRKEVGKILHQKLFENLSCHGQGKVLTEQSNYSNYKKCRLEINKSPEGGASEIP